MGSQVGRIFIVSMTKLFVLYLKKIYSIIHTSVYEFLLKHPFCDAFISVIKRAGDRDYCKTVSERNDMALICKSYGELHKDKNLYFIYHGQEVNGFFVQMRELLKYLAYADRFGFVPVILWSSSLPYAEKESVFGTTNPFEYYFQQPSGISVSEMRESYNVFQAKKIHIENSFLNREITGGENGYWISEEYILKLSGYVQKYIRFNLKTTKFINENISKIICDRRTVGVHIRGTDYNNHYNNHPVVIPVEEYFEAIDKLVQENGYEQIFLATDDIRLLERFSERYGVKLKYYCDTVRGDQDQSVAFSNNSRENHRYLLGLEVLRDMYTLACCDSLISGVSQVSLMARIFKKSSGSDYMDKIILDRGYYKNDNNFVI